MASVTSRPSSKSPSPFDFNSSGDDESWQYIDYSGGGNSAPSSIGFLPSPASGSLSGFAIVGHMTGAAPSPVASSPLLGEQAAFYPEFSFQGQSENGSPDVFATTTDGGFQQGNSFLTPQQFLFQQDGMGDFLPQQGMGDFSQPQSQQQQQQLNMSPDMDGRLAGMGVGNGFDMSPLMSPFGSEIFAMTPEQQNLVDLNMPQPLQSDSSVPQWNATTPMGDEGGMFIFEDITSSPKSMYSQSSASPVTQPGPSRSPTTSKIRKVKTGKVEKKKVDHSGQFVVLTQDAVAARAGRPNPFECFEAMRTSQRGRKGPLANATKENALQVRRQKACICCRIRKVKCDPVRPCQQCMKMTVQVPQAVCWIFDDFTVILFPEFIRGHFNSDVMAQFMKENIRDFTVDGVEQTCSVNLSCGPVFKSYLSIDAKIFTPETPDVVQHWHRIVLGKNQVYLQANGSAPIGLEMTTNAQRDNLRKRAKAFVQDTINEPNFVDQVTADIHWSDLPNKLLKIVKRFADQSDSLLVKRALSVYCMHYIMMHHLSLTPETLGALRYRGLVSQNDDYVTPRVLARQVKSIIDEMMKREVELLWDLFLRLLKPKSRREWAPCTAAFLVLCLFMEAVDVMADTFVSTQTEIDLKNQSRLRYQRSVAVNTCKEVENMPFKQFAHLFHQVYQTHSKDANAKSFNPFFSSNFAETGDLGPAAVEMVRDLTEMFYGDNWLDLQFLTADIDLDIDQQQPYSMGRPELFWTGRLAARFLMSFYDEKVIFGNSN